MKTLSEKLADNLLYYTSNPKRRCRNSDACKYHGKTLGIKTKGCFVGALLPAKTRAWADEVLENVSSCVGELIKVAEQHNVSIPNIVKDNTKMMQEFQSLHDFNDNWTDNGLSHLGVYKLAFMLRRYDSKLSPEPFMKCIPDEEMDYFMNLIKRNNGE